MSLFFWRKRMYLTTKRPARRELNRSANAAAGMATCMLCLLGGVVPARAQTSADSGAAEAGLQEITVTARRREEVLQNVPLAISAFTGSDLQAAGITDLRALAFLTPGITMNSNGAEGALQPVIRGLVNLNGGAGDPNVGVFLNGIYLQNNSAISLGMLDMERIEVVKGPVSALYGRNAFAGAINYVSNKAPSTFKARSTVTVGNDGQQLVGFSVGGPVFDTFQARIASAYDKYDGGYKDGVNGLRRGGHVKKDTQLALRWEPLEKLNLNAAFYYGDDFFDDIARSVNTNNCGTPGPTFAGFQFTAFNQYCGELRDNIPVQVAPVSPAAGTSGNQRRVQSGHLGVDYDFGWSTVSWLTGYNRVVQQSYVDFTGFRAGIPFVLTPGPGTVSLFEGFGADFNNEDFSQELRLASAQDQAFRWAVGGYYFKSRSAQSTLVGLNIGPVPAGQAVSPVFHGTALFFKTPDGSFSQSNLSLSKFTEKTVSEFVGLDYDLIDKLTLSGEFRHTKQDKTADLLRNTFVANTVRPFGLIPPISFGYNNYRVTAKYQFSPALMSYLSGANGTKSGGFNQRATIPSEFAFGPETNKTYEIGVKGNFLQNRLQANVAVFNIKTQDLQFQGVSDNPNQVGLVTKNFGGTKENGFELELAAAPIKGLRLSAGVGYVDAKFSSGTYSYSGNRRVVAATDPLSTIAQTNPAAAILTCLAIPSCAPKVVVLRNTVGAVTADRSAINLVGNKVPRTSELQFSAGAEYTYPINAEWDWISRVDYRHETKQYPGVENYNFFGARDLVNLRFAFRRDKLKLTLYSDNLTGDRTAETAAPNTRLNDFVADWQVYLPKARTFGVTVDYAF